MLCWQRAFTISEGAETVSGTVDTSPSPVIEECAAPHIDEKNPVPGLVLLVETAPGVPYSAV